MVSQHPWQVEENEDSADWLRPSVMAGDGDVGHLRVIEVDPGSDAVGPGSAPIVVLQYEQGGRDQEGARSCYALDPTREVRRRQRHGKTLD